MNVKKSLRALLGIPAIILCAGCSTYEMTNPQRSVTEQLLLSTAADRAIGKITFESFAHKKVYVDTNYFQSYDSAYVLGQIRDALSQAGALLVNNATNSEIVVEARSGGLSTDYSSTLIGVPQSGLPVPLAGVVNLPELALYKSNNQKAIAKLALLAYSTKSLEHYFSSGPALGTSYNSYYKLLGIVQWTHTDIPEKKRAKKEEKEHRAEEKASKQ